MKNKFGLTYALGYLVGLIVASSIKLISAEAPGWTFLLLAVFIYFVGRAITRFIVRGE